MKVSSKRQISLLTALIAMAGNATMYPVTTWNAIKHVAQMPYSFIAYYLTKKPQSSEEQLLSGKYEPAEKSYLSLNEDKHNPFSVSIGTAMSQSAHTNNTVHPHFLIKLLQKVSQKSNNPAQWLKEHWGYVVQSIADITCNKCSYELNFHNLSTDKNSNDIDTIVNIIAANKNAQSIAMTKCPKCHSTDITQHPKQVVAFTDEQDRQMTAQLRTLGSFDQIGAKSLPGYRLSIELADILKDGSDEMDPAKLKKQSQRLKDLHYPLTFFHHYANPQCKPNLFENKNDITWFAKRCADIVRECPGLTHVCPISQIMGFGMQVSRGTLPPFEISINQNEFLKTIVQAQVEAGRAMKKINPNLKVLVSHQWKPMKPKHGMLDPRYALEALVCKIADYMYNQKFVSLLKEYSQDFDGIALSVYPALYFDMWKTESDNCSGKLDPKAALEAIEKISQSFPGKDIYIVETGCNNANTEMKKKFVDMTLHACKLAREKGIPVKTCYFWGHTNKSYMEWNKAPGETNFGAFETFVDTSPNEYGKYLQDILTNRSSSSSSAAAAR